MDQVLQQIVLERLDQAALREDAKLLVLAACEGVGELASALGGQAPPRPDSVGAGSEVDPAGAYLGPVCVEGFRGIGPEATLGLVPGPGLTLVVGRNGSGKSSFAEALELLLTEDTRRWSQRSAIWKEGWRNVHHLARTQLRAELVPGRAPDGPRDPRVAAGAGPLPAVPLLQRARHDVRRRPDEALRDARARARA